MIQDSIELKLRAALNPEYLEIHNESHRHNVPAGSESHFKVIIVSELFTGQRLLQRHRAIYAAVSAELAESVHALALHAYTHDEWEILRGEVPLSPDCYGAGVHR